MLCPWKSIKIMQAHFYKVLVFNPERKTPFGRPKPNLEDNIKIYVQKLE
jgi:hypothetical protein